MSSRILLSFPIFFRNLEKQFFFFQKRRATVNLFEKTEKQFKNIAECLIIDDLASYTEEILASNYEEGAKMNIQEKKVSKKNFS